MTAIRLRAVFVAATVVWAALLVAVPYLASRDHAASLVSTVIVGVYGVGGLVCHQLPGRSYHLWAAQMPVCARCAGIYFGAVAGALAAVVFHPSARRARLALALAVTPSLITLVYEWTAGVMPSHAMRAAAGVPVGVVVAWLVVAVADNQVN